MPFVPSLRGLLHRQHSCRAFRPEVVPQQTIREVLAAAHLALSWCNTKP